MVMLNLFQHLRILNGIQENIPGKYVFYEQTVILNLFQHLLNGMKLQKRLFVYIMSNYKRTTFYIGVTNSIERRVAEHKEQNGNGFTTKYKLTDLLYYEEIFGALDAILREKQLKNWHRDWKINLIKEDNPEMRDLARDWVLEDSETSSG